MLRKDKNDKISNIRINLFSNFRNINKRSFFNMEFESKESIFISGFFIVSIFMFFLRRSVRKKLNDKNR